MDRLEHALKHQAEPKRERGGFIYIIQCRDFVKVGIANEPSFRLMELQVGCPYELKLLAAFKTDNANRDEKRLHAEWKRYALRGEWFQVPFGELVSAINAETFDGIFV